MRNEKDSRYILRMSKKIKAINFLGGKCEKCGNDNIFHLIFHHKNENKKSNGISGILAHRWSEIEVEIKKCILLCCNCHQELHGSDSTIKQKLLELKGENECSVCGYKSINNASLSFHHKKEKSFWITSKCNYTRNEFGIPIDKLLTEMEKCVVVCENCHRNIHADTNRYMRLKNKIYDKINNYVESSPYRNLLPKDQDKRIKCDIDLCLNLRKEGKTIEEIQKITSYCLLSIKKIFSRNGIAGRIRHSQNEVIGMWKNGKTIKDIMKEKGYAECTIYSFLKKDPEILKQREEERQKRQKVKEQIVQDFENGESTTNIGRKFNHSHVHIRRILKQLNIMVPSRKISIKKIFKQYLEGKTIEEISKETHCSERRIVSLLSRNHIF